MSRRMPALKPQAILRALLRAGFYVHHQCGSHAQLRHNTKENLRVTVPVHNRFDLPPEIVKNILEQAELPREKFLRLL